MPLWDETRAVCVERADPPDWAPAGALSPSGCAVLYGVSDVFAVVTLEVVVVVPRCLQGNSEACGRLDIGRT